MTALLVLDFETTGLDPNKDRILQVACQLISAETLEPLSGVGSREYALFANELDLEHMEPFVREMHTKSGLLERVPNGYHLDSVESFLIRYLDGRQNVVLAGDSIHFDRAFLRRWMPSLSEALHYKMLDTTSLYLAMEAWGLPTFTARNPNAHEALSDVLWSIKKLKFYRDALTGLLDETRRYHNRTVELEERLQVVRQAAG